MQGIFYTSIALFLLLSFFMCFIILIQESKSSGLGASFGSNSSDSVFGTGTADVLSRMTSMLAIFFLGSCVVLSIWTSTLGKSPSSAMTPRTMVEQLQSQTGIGE